MESMLTQNLIQSYETTEEILNLTTFIGPSFFFKGDFISFAVKRLVKVNESWYIALFVVCGSIKKRTY